MLYCDVIGIFRTKATGKLLMLKVNVYSDRSLFRLDLDFIAILVMDDESQIV